jgi:hypothetical protein
VRFLKNNWPVAVAVAVLWAALFIVLRLSLARNQGHLIYALDDGYVEMAIAKNFSRYGVWGVTRYGFTSATSSILWPLLLSGVYVVFGVNEIAPLILNIISATMVVVAAYLFLKSLATPGVYRFSLLLAVIFLTPLVPLVFTGMEHVAHVLVTIMFAFLSARLLARESFAWKERDSLALLALALLLALLRYEGVFIVFVVCTLLLLRRRVAYSLALGLLALAPIGIYGLISVKHGAFWLPNSLLLKALLPVQSISGFLYYAKDKFIAAANLSLLMILALSAYFLRPRRPAQRWNQDLCLLMIFLGASILHLVFAAVGWFYRYEAYLVALGILANGRLLWKAFAAWANSESRHGLRYGMAVGVLPVLLVATLYATIKRGTTALRETPQVTTNIYDQQYQMARFLRDHYQGTTVAANDVGAINVLADIKCLDVFGLANMTVAKAKLENTYTARQIYELGKDSNAQIAIVYDEWLEAYGGAPAQWTWVGEWRIRDNLICASDRVQFYAVNPAEAVNLAANLENFSTGLPPGVTGRGCTIYPPYVLGTRLDLTQREADPYLCHGWSAGEPSIRWTDRPKALILFAVNEVKPSSLRLKLGPFLAPSKLDEQRMTLKLNDQLLASLRLTEAKEYTFALPENLLREKNVLEFGLPDAASPMSLGVSPDWRRLGVDVKWMEIKPEAGGR